MRRLVLILTVAAAATAPFLVQDVRASATRILHGAGVQMQNWAGQVMQTAPGLVGELAQQVSEWARPKVAAVAPQVADWVASVGSRRSACVDDPDAFDYNCDLPGKGYPWLLNMTATGPDGEVLCVPWYFVSWIGGMDDFHVPVPIDDDWCPEDIRDVYRRLCQVHPELGGGGLAPLPEKGTYWFTDGGDGFPHWYRLPPIPERIFQDALEEARRQAERCSQQPRKEAEETPEEPEQKQEWRVFVKGYEIDEMDPYWQVTTKLRAAVRFDYSLKGQFVLTRRDEAWVFDSGSITLASVGLRNLYEPEGTWEIRPLRCRGCEKVSAATKLTGEVYGDEVRLSWGMFRPSVDAEARIVISCKPEPACAQWGQRTYVSETFFDRIGGELLPLQDGFTKTYAVTSPQGSTWVSYTYTLTLVQKEN